MSRQKYTEYMGRQLVKPGQFFTQETVLRELHGGHGESIQLVKRDLIDGSSIYVTLVKSDNIKTECGTSTRPESGVKRFNFITKRRWCE